MIHVFVCFQQSSRKFSDSTVCIITAFGYFNVCIFSIKNGFALFQFFVVKFELYIIAIVRWMLNFVVALVVLYFAQNI